MSNKNKSNDSATHAANAVSSILNLVPVSDLPSVMRALEDGPLPEARRKIRISRYPLVKEIAQEAWNWLPKENHAKWHGELIERVIEKVKILFSSVQTRQWERISRPRGPITHVTFEANIEVAFRIGCRHPSDIYGYDKGYREGFISGSWSKDEQVGDVTPNLRRASESAILCSNFGMNYGEDNDRKMKLLELLKRDAYWWGQNIWERDTHPLERWDDTARIIACTVCFLVNQDLDSGSQKQSWSFVTNWLKDQVSKIPKDMVDDDPWAKCFDSTKDTSDGRKRVKEEATDDEGEDQVIGKKSRADYDA